MTQRVVIGTADTTFSATCTACGTSFAGRLDEDIDGGVFLCRFGHPIQIAREEPPVASSAGGRPPAADEELRGRESAVSRPLRAVRLAVDRRANARVRRRGAPRAGSRAR